MDKNYYFVVTKEDNGKFGAYVLKIYGRRDLISFLPLPGFHVVNIYATKMEANKKAKKLNEAYRKNGTYLWEM